MTRNDLYTFATTLTGGQLLDETLFETLLDISQMEVEDTRPWVYARSEDTGQTASPADTFTTAKTLAISFKEWFEEAPIQLLDANSNTAFLTEVPYSERYRYQKSGGKFCVDYPNNNFYLLGTITQSYTIKQSFIQTTTLVSGAASNSWKFPSRFHKILGLMVAAKWRNGIDYDVFNNILGDKQAQQALAMLDVMTRWDSNLQMNMQRGKDPFNSNTIGSGSTSGGTISF